MVDENKLNQDIGDLLSNFEVGGEPPEAPPTERPPEEKPSGEAPPQEKPPEEVPPTERPPEEVPPEEKPPEEKPPGESDRYKELEEQNKRLLERIDRISRLPVEPPRTEDDRLIAPSEEKGPEPLEDFDFIKGRSLEEITEDPKLFNELLNDVYKRGYEVALERVAPVASEKTLTSIPQVVVRYVRQHMAMADIVKDFYKENEDLIPVKRTVGAMANEVYAEHPDWKVAEVLTEAAKRSRDVLGMKEKVRRGEKPPGKEKSPAFADAGGNRGGPAPKPSKLEREIGELIDLE